MDRESFNELTHSYSSESLAALWPCPCCDIRH